MTPFGGYVLIKQLLGSAWRGLEFYGFSRGRWFVGFVRFDHRNDPPRAV